MQTDSLTQVSGFGSNWPIFRNFLGNAPVSYKLTIIGFLILNTVLVGVLGESGYTLVGWLFILEFIFTLAMALKCYPLLPGGLLAIQAVALGLTNAQSIYQEAVNNFPVLMLLMFMVAGIYFMKDLLLFAFTKLLVNVKSKTLLSLAFAASAAFLSAFLDALTVTAVLISVSVGFYSIYQKVSSEQGKNKDENWKHNHVADLEQFRACLRSLLMHGAVGTALGGVTTLVGEPQNLLIAHQAGWQFKEFFWQMAPVTLPVLAAGLITTLVLEKTKWFGYGVKMPAAVMDILKAHAKHEETQLDAAGRTKLYVQAAVAAFLIFALATHMAEVGLIGLTVIVLLAAFNGVTDEHAIGKSFQEALPFTALLVVFFAIVSVIHQQHLFSPVINWVLAQEPSIQPGLFFVANGILSAISDNVFVATVYINEVKQALDAGLISREHFEKLAIAINTGTNLPSVATPNGQAAFLFLLTSAIAPLIKLSYGRMAFMALPYTAVLSILGYIGITHFI